MQANRTVPVAGSKLLIVGGVIVTMSSGLADVCKPGYGPYSAAKAAVAALTRTLAREMAPGIRCNCVSPGGIDTPKRYRIFGLD